MSDQFSQEKKFSSFFWPFFVSESFNSKKKIFENFFIFLKILTQNDPFWPKFRPKKPNLTKNIFFVILKSYDFQRGVTCLCLKKFNFSVPKRVVGPEFWRTGIFGKNPAGSTFFEYCPPTSGQKSGKSLEPFSRNFRLTTIFGPFWAILGHFGTVWPKIRETGFFGRNPALSLSSLYQVVTCCQVSEKSSEPFWRK